MGDAGEIHGRARGLGEREQNSAVESQAPGRRQRVLDRHACQLVPERDPAARRDQDAGGEALVDRVEASPADREVSSASSDGGAIEAASTTADADALSLRDAREHDVAHRRRGSDGPTRREHLGHVERVPRRQAVELAASAPWSCRQLRDPLGRQRRERQRLTPSRGRELAEDDPQGIEAVELVVAVGREYERRRAAHPPAEHTHDVERRLVGPVDVLQDEHERPPTVTRAEERGSDRVRTTSVDRLGDRARCLGGDLEDRPERRRREEGVAGAPEDRGGFAELVGEPPHQRGLADPGLPAHEDEAALPLPRLRECLMERRKGLASLHELGARRRGDCHPPMVRLSRALEPRP